ncbi:MAG: 2-oxo acid dehydrogenase subunit E2 [Planctomycetaceae bacterium]|nr:2-oxo acid dehydrogenase subunit E2 [Planctomycetaceae bacterium]
MIKDVRVPEISENVDTGQVISVLVKPGDHVTVDQSLVELETEKAAFEVPCEVEGTISEVLIKEGQTVQVGQVIFKIDTGSKTQAQEPQEKASEPVKQTQPPQQTARPQPAEGLPAAAEPEKPAPTKSAASVPAAPSVRQLARELGVDIAQVKGTAAGGRVSDQDVKEFARRLIAQCGSAAKAKPSEEIPLPDFSKWGPVERQAVSATRKKVAETMSNAWSQVAHVTQHDQADITLLKEFMAEYAEPVKQAGGKLTVTAVVLKAAVMALRNFPNVNASYDPQAEEIIFKKYFHIAVAVDTDRGLLVPVIRDADKKNMLGLSVELSQLAEKARRHKIMPDELFGGTFTLTNLGSIGGTSFTPIVYWPQSAILGISRAVQQPIYREGRLEPRWMLPLSLSYDHRLIDGAEGLRFLRSVIEMLEKPFLLAMEETRS